ncbi:hypothetical protein J437_LFUL011438 [Ladona fulva]|uniref:Uncharacterized protein n=1 Tax=Ladona fulva TaxID=123851 RepID=A0A8K0KER9_LADFU|nr:hypothetical protein J437_LFUL011438 [Ladona fulva]
MSGVRESGTMGGMSGAGTPGGGSVNLPGGGSSEGGSRSGGKSTGKSQVKPFTKESLEKLENKTVQLVREYGFQPRRRISVEDGSVLPEKYEPFPRRFYGRPLEEIDNFIYDEVSFTSSMVYPVKTMKRIFT